MAYGIGSILGDIDQKADMYRNNPEALAQSYQQNQQLIDLLVLQKLKTDKEAAQRDMQAKMQTPAGTIKDQRQAEIMDMTRNEVVQQVSPGLQSLAQQQQEAPAEGIASVPAPTMGQIGMAEGGIVMLAAGSEKPVKGASSTAEDLTDPIVGYTPKGNPIRQSELDAMTAPLRENTAKGREEFLASQAINPTADTPEDVARRAAFAALGTERAGPTNIEEVATQRARNAPAPNILDMLAMAEQVPGPKIASHMYGATPSLPEELEVARSNAGPALEELQQKMNKGIGALPTLAGAQEPPIAAPQAAPQATQMLPENEDVIYGASLARGAPKAEAILSVPTEEVKRAPSEAQASYTQQLADLRMEQEDKLDSLIAFLQGAGGKTSFAAAMRGGSEGMSAREEGIKAEIMDVLGKLETIDLKEREFGLAEEGVAVNREQLALQGERDKATAENNAEQNRIARAQLDATLEASKYNADRDLEAKLVQIAAAGALTPENNIAMMKLVDEKWSDSAMDELVLSAFNAERARQGVNSVPLDEVYDPEYVTQFNAMRERLKDANLRQLRAGAMGNGGSEAPTGFTYLGTE